MSTARDNQAVTADLVVPNTDGLVGKVPKVSLPDADGAIQLKSALSAGEEEESVLEAAALERARRRAFELSEIDADIAKQEVTRGRIALVARDFSFEEAHDRNWDVAKGPRAVAVEFYKVFFSETLPELEAEPREWLVVDFLKKCWGYFGPA